MTKKFKLEIHCCKAELGKLSKPGHKLHRIVFHSDLNVECLDHTSDKDRDLLMEYQMLSSLAGEEVRMVMPVCLWIKDLWVKWALNKTKSIAGGKKDYQTWILLSGMIVSCLPKNKVVRTLKTGESVFSHDEFVTEFTNFASMLGTSLSREWLKQSLHSVQRLNSYDKLHCML
jgi:hypothetical protein